MIERREGKVVPGKYLKLLIGLETSSYFFQHQLRCEQSQQQYSQEPQPHNLSSSDKHQEEKFYQLERYNEELVNIYHNIESQAGYTRVRMKIFEHQVHWKQQGE